MIRTHVKRASLALLALLALSACIWLPEGDGGGRGGREEHRGGHDGERRGGGEGHHDLIGRADAKP